MRSDSVWKVAPGCAAGVSLVLMSQGLQWLFCENLECVTDSQEVVRKESCTFIASVVLGMLLLGHQLVQVFVVMHGALYSAGVLSGSRCMAIEWCTMACSILQDSVLSNILAVRG